MVTMRERQRAVQLYRGQIPSPGRPTVAWREDRVKFWAAIARGVKTEDAAAEAKVSSPVAFRWFRHAGGVNPCLPPPCLVDTSPSPSVKTSRCGMRSSSVCARSPVGSGGHRRRSRGSCAATRRLERSVWSIGRRSRSGTPSGALVARRSRSSSPTSVCAQYVQDPARRRVVSCPDGRVVGPPGPKWNGKNKPHRGDRRWVQAWSPEQIANRLPVEFPHDGLHADQPRGHLSGPLRAGPRRAHARAGRAVCGPGERCEFPRARARQKAWAHVTAGGADQRTSRRGRRPRRCRDIGKVICSSAWNDPRSARWSSARPVSRC